MKLGIIVCDGNEKWMPLYETICNRCFRKEEDSELTYFHAWRGEVPTIHNTQHLDAVVSLGSAHMVTDTSLQWMKDLSKFFLAVGDTNLKVLAICFSHQLINKAYGGEVDVSEHGFIFGANPIKFENFKNLPTKLGNILKNFAKDGKELELNLLESHREEVSELPPKAILVGSSKYCRAEVVLVRRNILTFQSHPDLTPGLMMEKIWPAITAKEYVREGDKSAVEEQMKGLDTDKSLKIIREFLKS